MIKDHIYPSKDEMLSYVLDFIGAPWSTSPTSNRVKAFNNRSIYEKLSDCRGEAEFEMMSDILDVHMNSLDFIALVRYSIVKFRLGTNLWLWPWLFDCLSTGKRFDCYAKHNIFVNNFINGYHSGPYEYLHWSFPLIEYEGNDTGLSGYKHDFDAAVLFAVSQTHKHIAEYVPMMISKDWDQMSVEKYMKFFELHANGIVKAEHRD